MHIGTKTRRSFRDATILSVVVITLFSYSGCKSWDIGSVRRVAYVASLSTPTAVKVKEKERSAFKDRVRSLVNLTPKPSDRSIEFLQQQGLYKTWKNSPEVALSRISQLVENDQNLETIFALANLKFVWAERLRMAGEEQHSISEYADTAVLAYRFLFDQRYDRFRNAYDPNFRGICDLYNQSLEEMLRLVSEKETLRPNYRYTIRTEAGEINFTVRAEGRWKTESIGELRFVSDYETSGLRNRFRTYGLGVPLVARWQSDQSNSFARKYYPTGLRIPLTAFLKVNDQTSSNRSLDCTLHLWDPLENRTINIANRTAPLESDVTTPLAVFLSDPLLNTTLLGVFSMINADIAQEVAGLYMLDPFDPNKIPVVLVHGLASTPMTWTEMFNDLRANPKIRENYQFWFYMYPSGQPFWVTAREMRREFAELETHFAHIKNREALQKMVFVGHSMGGLVSRMQTIESGKEFWKLVSDQPVEQLKGDAPIRRDLLDTLFFKPNPSISKVITISSPHLGSNFANDTTIWLSRTFFKLPQLFRGTEEIVKQNPDYFRDTELLSTKTSVDSLSPQSPFFKAVQRAKIAPWITYHNIYGHAKHRNVFSIIGQKIAGEGDGVVPLESSRAIPAKTELEVDATHSGIHMNAQTILEVKRILLQNLIDQGRLAGHAANGSVINLTISTQPIDGNIKVPYGTHGSPYGYHGSVTAANGHGHQHDHSNPLKIQSTPINPNDSSIRVGDLKPLPDQTDKTIKR